MNAFAEGEGELFIYMQTLRPNWCNMSQRLYALRFKLFIKQHFYHQFRLL
jgi:hypothetical protein